METQSLLGTASASLIEEGMVDAAASETKSRRRVLALLSAVALVTVGAAAFTSTTSSTKLPQLQSAPKPAQAAGVVDTASDLFCISARNEKYDELEAHTLKMYHLDLVLEPAANNILTVGACEGKSVNADDYSVQWTVDAIGKFAKEHATFIFKDDVKDAASVTVVTEPANTEFMIKATLTSKDGTTYVSERKSDVKVVRRELRKLTESDREAYFRALHAVFTTDGETGRAKYGDGFTSHGELSALHNDMNFLYHNNLFFQTSHPAMQLRLERSLRSVNPNVATPYWDFLVDAKLGSNWGDSEVYDESWFGTVMTKGETGYRPEGRFHDVPRTLDVNEKEYPQAWHNVYGYLGSPLSTSKSSYMTRSGSVCNFELQQGFANCEHVSMCFAKFLASYV